MKRLIIYRLGSLGDTVVALPCFHRIAQSFPDHERIVLTNIPVSSKAAPLEIILKPSGLIHGALEYPVGVRSIGQILSLRQRLRAQKADTLVYLMPSRGLFNVVRDLLFFRSCGFSRFIGAPLTRDLMENRIDPDTGFQEPEAERLARTMAPLGAIDLRDRSCWDLRLTNEEKAVATRALAPLGGRAFFAINLGGKAEEKDWGDLNWRQLLHELATALPEPLALVVIGGADDFNRCEAVIANWPHQRLNLCGVLSPREGAAAIAAARFFIGHDSGPLHMAAAVGTSCIGLFGNYNVPRKWHPYAPAVRVLHEKMGLESLSVNQVLAEVMDLLSAGFGMMPPGEGKK